jgi:hypothetical protein
MSAAPQLKLGRGIRWKVCYSIPQAGWQRGWSRAESYKEAAAGNMKGLVRFGEKLMGVRKSVWDRETRRVLKAAR